MCNFNIEKSKDGYDLIRVNIDEKWIYIGSKYNQKKEVNRFIKSFGIITLDDIYVVIGLSCGEHIRDLLKETKGNENKILIFEPNKEWLLYALENHVVDDLMKIDRVQLTGEAEDIKIFFKNFVGGLNVDRIKFSAYANYNKLYLEECKNLMEHFRNLKVDKILNRNTNIDFAETWFNTLIDNLNVISKSTPLNYLQNKYKNVPAIIVSAGPSLEKNIDQLKGIENALILSGGRTLKPLMDKKIKIDGLVVIDPAKESYDLVDGYIDKAECPLFFYDGTNSDVVNKHKGSKILTQGNNMVDRVFNMEIEGMNFAGSVAHSSTLLAAKLGCNPIIFIGQDLAYTNDKGYAEIANREHSEEFKSELDTYIYDIYGKKVRTSLALNAFKVDFEELIELLPNNRFIDATEGGAYIKGTEIKTLKETLDEISNDKVTPIKTFIKEFDVIDNIITELETSLKIIRNASEKCNDGLKMIGKLNKAVEKNSNKEIEELNLKLDKIDENLKADINNLDILESLLVGKVYEIEQDSKFLILKEDSQSEINKKIIGKSIEIYKELEVKLKKAESKISEYIKNNRKRG